MVVDIILFKFFDVDYKNIWDLLLLKIGDEKMINHDEKCVLTK